MIKRKEEMTVRELTGVQSGKGTVKFCDWLKEPAALAHGRLFSKIIIEPGCSIGPHTHTGEFEAFYIIAGEATVTDGDAKYKLLHGDMHYCADGGYHGVENCGSETLELLAIILKTA